MGPANFDRFVILLGLFYASNNKANTAQMLYSEFAMKSEKQGQINYTLVMALNLLGRLLLKDPEQQLDACKYLR